MNKKLPDIFANPIEKDFHNTQDTYYGKLNDSSRTDHRSIEEKINSIFASKGFVYKSKVRIELAKETKICTLVGKTDKTLLTMENETILISDIIDIEVI